MHLEIVADLIKALLALGNYEAAKAWHEQGFGILRDLVNQVYRSDTPQPPLQRGG